MLPQRTFLTVWFGQFVSVLGTTLTGFALAVYVFVETGSVTRLAAVLAAVAVPGILLAPIAGVIVDRFDRRAVMLGADIIAGAGSVVLALSYFADGLELWLIIPVLAVASAAQAFQEPAYLATIPTLVPKEQIGRANGLVQLAQAAGHIIAPFAAGALLATVGMGVVFVIDVATFGVAVVTLLVVRFPGVRAEAPPISPSMRGEAVEGFRFLWDRQGMFRFLMLAAVLNLLFGFVNVLFAPLFLAFTNEAVMGAALSVAGVGMLVGSLLMSAWGGPKQRVRGMLVFVALLGVGIAVSGLRPSVVVAGAGTLIVMLILPLVNGTSQAFWQVKVPLAMQGRVFSTRRMLATVASPLAYVLAGPLADGLFEPAMAEGGWLGSLLGDVIGAGAGRGIGAMFVFIGLATVLLAVIGWTDPRVRNLEADYPDAIEPSAEADLEPVAEEIRDPDLAR